MKDQGPSCGGCKFSIKADASTGETDLAKLVKDTLVCKRHPPTALVMVVGQNAGGLVTAQATAWPQVTPSMHCFEHQPKVPDA